MDKFDIFLLLLITNIFRSFLFNKNKNKNSLFKNISNTKNKIKKRKDQQINSYKLSNIEWIQKIKEILCMI